MKTKKILKIVVGMVALLTIIGVTTVFGYYFNSTTNNSNGSMGIVDVALKDGGTNVTEKNGEYEKKVTILNKSKIDIYLRAGYTIIVVDKNEKTLPVDVSGVTIDKITSNDGKTIKINNRNVDGYSKDMIEFENINGSLLEPIKPTDTNISFTLKFKTPKNFKLPKNSNFKINVNPEAIQATDGALKSASKYGWQCAH